MRSHAAFDEEATPAIGKPVGDGHDRTFDLVIRKIRDHHWTVPLACTYRTRDAGDPLITCVLRAVRATTRHRRS